MTVKVNGATTCEGRLARQYSHVKRRPDSHLQICDRLCELSCCTVLYSLHSHDLLMSLIRCSANEQAQRMNKKTIQPKDVLDAIVDIEFPFFLERLDAELQKYNAVQCDKRNSYRRKVREEQKTKSAAALAEAGLGSDAAEAGAGGKQGEEKTTVGTNGVPNITSPKRDEGEPSAKRVKGDDGAQVEDEDEEEDAPDEPEEEPQEDEAEVEEEEDDEDEAGEQFEDAKEDLAEDFLEERQGRDEDMEDEALDDGNDSD